MPRAVLASLPNQDSDNGCASSSHMTAGFPRSLRLLKAAEFKAVFANACKSGDGNITLLARANGMEHPRLGMAISRKSVRLAVGRNRIKRQLREYLRLHQDQIGGFDLVVLCRSGVNQLDKQALRQAIENCFIKLSQRCAGT